MKTVTIRKPIQKNPSTATSGRAEFTCHAPQASSVFLAGTFNDWKPDTLAMERNTEGTWRLTLALPTGHHEFKFVVDGAWCCQPGCNDHAHEGCPTCVPNDCGTMNRVLELA